jgi:hypothetical protein
MVRVRLFLYCLVEQTRGLMSDCVLFAPQRVAFGR